MMKFKKILFRREGYPTDRGYFFKSRLRVDLVPILMVIAFILTVAFK